MTNILIEIPLSNHMPGSFESSDERKEVQFLDDEDIAEENFNELASRLSKTVIRKKNELTMLNLKVKPHRNVQKVANIKQLNHPLNYARTKR